jgi:hypothetical protein
MTTNQSAAPLYEVITYLLNVANALTKLAKINQDNAIF